MNFCVYLRDSGVIEVRRNGKVEWVGFYLHGEPVEVVRISGDKEAVQEAVLWSGKMPELQKSQLDAPQS